MGFPTPLSRRFSISILVVSLALLGVLGTETISLFAQAVGSEQAAQEPGRAQARLEAAFRTGGTPQAMVEASALAGEARQQGIDSGLLSENQALTPEELEKAWNAAFGEGPLEVFLPSTVVAHWAERLIDRGLSFAADRIRQSPAARLEEAYYRFLNAALPKDKVETLRVLLETARAQGLVDGDRNIAIGVSGEDIAEGNQKLSEIREGAGLTFTAAERIAESGDILMDPVRPTPADRKLFRRIADVRLAVGAGLGPIAGPVMGLATGATVGAGKIVANLVGAIWEWQFAKKIRLWGGRSILGPDFWARRMAQYGQRVPMGLNIVIPLSMTLFGALASALAGEPMGHTWGDTVFHTGLSFVTFGVLSFAFAQVKWMKQVVNGYTKRINQWIAEGAAVALLVTMRFVASSGAFNKSVLWSLFEGTRFQWDFKLEHAVGYGSHLAFALLVSSGLMLLHGLHLPFTKWQIVPSAWNTIDAEARAALYGTEKPGWCRRAIASLGSFYQLRWGKRKK